MRISVALATYQGARHLEAQLASIVAERPDEIVVGDDQSDDGTVGILEAYARRGPLRWERNPVRLGSAGNFERVARRCEGEVVVFADQDDVWLPGRLGRIEAALAADPGASFVFGDGVLIDELGAPLGGTLFDRVGFGAAERARFREGDALWVLLRRNVITGATLAVRRAELLRALPIEAGWVHDYYLGLLLSVLGHGVVLEDRLIQYRVHGGQQIGVLRQSPRALFTTARRQTAAQCRREADGFARLGERLSALGVAAGAPALAALADKARFWQRRAEMRELPWRAPALLWGSWRRDDYRRLSAGWQQAVVDVVAAVGRRRA
jgi:hypothetical protein